MRGGKEVGGGEESVPIWTDSTPVSSFFTHMAAASIYMYHRDREKR